MTRDADLVAYEDRVRARGAALRALAAELRVNAALIVAESRALRERLRREGYSGPPEGRTPSRARLVNAVREWGGRVVAVGTTVVRALETVAAPDGTVAPAAGWTNLVVGRERPLRAVDGLLTGWHEPEASHLRLLEAAAGDALLARCYRAALEHGYLWHEFGDSHLVMRTPAGTPGPPARRGPARRA